MTRLLAIALLGVSASALAQQTPPLQARTTAATYVHMAASADNYEQESSKLALQHTSNPEVRAFAQMMVNDHANTSAQVMAAAKAASIGKPGAPNERHTGMLKALRSVGHDRMERTYVDQQVKAHEEALAIHSGYAAQGDNPGLRAVAAEAVPIIERHLAEIRRIQAMMGGPMG